MSELYQVTYEDEFQDWLDSLDEKEQTSVMTVVYALEQRRRSLGFPLSGVVQSRHRDLRELRIQHGGRTYVAFYAIDADDVVVLLEGGDPTSDFRFYKRMVPKAEAIYDRYLEEKENGETD